ncbi:MAG: hypothetical protein HN423_05595, partial [Alphaproteobacteria bacterium]|nr:hypothetical protein [Alphaproteobacteria bacterium]
MGTKIKINERTLHRLGRCLLTAATVAASLWSSAANADFAAGVVAYEAGDFAAAFEQWLPEAEAGNDAAQRNIGLLYQSGQGVEA